MAATLDILPTVVAVAGAPLPALPIDGLNLLPALTRDREESPRSEFLFYYGGELRGVREGRWKRVYEHRTRSYQGVEPGIGGVPGPYAFPTVPAALYDLHSDPGETTDVASEHPEVVARLDALAEKGREALGDRLRGRQGSEVRPPGRRSFPRGDSLEHLAMGAPVTLNPPPDPRYPGKGPASLTDGRLGTRDHRDGSWLGFSGVDLAAVVELDRPRALRSIGVDCLRAQDAWIFFPVLVEFQVSADGRVWKELGSVREPAERNPEKASKRFQIVVPQEVGPVRTIRVVARNHGALPHWHPGAGEDAWLFVDEVVVE